MMRLSTHDPKPLYEQIMDNYRHLIVSGGISPGEQLPSVRELATQLAINPNTIQRAYRALEADGWIVTVPGKGCFVSGCEKATEQERARWYDAFDEAAAALLALGVSRESLILRLPEGGNKHA